MLGVTIVTGSSVLGRILDITTRVLREGCEYAVALRFCVESILSTPAILTLLSLPYLSRVRHETTISKFVQVVVSN